MLNRKPLKGLTLTPRKAQRDLRPSILCAAGDRRVWCDRIRSAQAAGLYPSYIYTSSSKSLGQNSCPILCQLLQCAFIAAVISERFDRDLIIGIVGQQSSELIELCGGRGDQTRRARINPYRFIQNQCQSMTAVPNRAETAECLLQCFRRSSLISGTLLRLSAGVFGLLLAFNSRETDLRVFRVRPHGLNLVAQSGDLSARIAQLLAGVQRIALRQLTRVTFIFQFCFQT